MGLVWDFVIWHQPGGASLSHPIVLLQLRPGRPWPCNSSTGSHCSVTQSGRVIRGQSHLRLLPREQERAGGECEAAGRRRVRRERRKEQQGTELGFQQVPLRVIGSGCINPGVIRTLYLLHRGEGERVQGDENNKDGNSGGGSFPVLSIALDESKITNSWQIHPSASVEHPRNATRHMENTAQRISLTCGSTSDAKSNPCSCHTLPQHLLVHLPNPPPQTPLQRT